jgi:hypothetical protein
MVGTSPTSSGRASPGRSPPCDRTGQSSEKSERAGPSFSPGDGFFRVKASPARPPISRRPASVHRDRGHHPGRTVGPRPIRRGAVSADRCPTGRDHPSSSRPRPVDRLDPRPGDSGRPDRPAISRWLWCVGLRRASLLQLRCRSAPGLEQAGLTTTRRRLGDLTSQRQNAIVQALQRHEAARRPNRFGATASAGPNTLMHTGSRRSDAAATSCAPASDRSTCPSRARRLASRSLQPRCGRRRPWSA